VGIVGGELLLDLNFQEDSSAQVDMNVVATGSGKLAEVHAMGEENTYTREQHAKLLDVALMGIEKLVGIQQQLYDAKVSIGLWRKTENKEVCGQ
jgi:ribonuclease PH